MKWKKAFLTVCTSVIVFVVAFFAVVFQAEPLNLDGNASVNFRAGNSSLVFPIDESIRKEIIGTLNEEAGISYHLSGPTPKIASYGSLHIQGNTFSIVGEDSLYLYNRWITQKWKVKGLQSKFLPQYEKELGISQLPK